jgi:hypothetical protein
MIKKCMEQRKITYKQLAQYVMLPTNVIKSWVEGKCEISYAHAFMIYDILEILSTDLQEMQQNM